MGRPPGGSKTWTVGSGLTLRGTIAPSCSTGRPSPGRLKRMLRSCWSPLSLRTGKIDITDNLSSHEGAKFRHPIDAGGAKFLLLPAYRPYHNPIEMAFTKRKALLGTANENSAVRPQASTTGILQTLAA